MAFAFVWPLILSSKAICAEGEADANSLSAQQIVYFILYPFEGPNAWGYEVQVFADRRVIYIGKGMVQAVGERRYSVTDEKFKRLLAAFDNARFLTMQSQAAALEPSLELHFSKDGKSNRIQAGSPHASWPKELFELIWAIEEDLDLNALVCPTYRVVNGRRTPVSGCATFYESMKRVYGEK